MVLTPHDAWHNHGNVGGEPAVNLSVLDLPLVETLNAVYFEHEYTEMVDGKRGQKKVQTDRSRPTTPQRYLRQGWPKAPFPPASSRRAAFPRRCMSTAGRRCRSCSSAQGLGWRSLRGAVIEYIDPATGGPVFNTMTFFVQMLRPGEQTLPLRRDRQPAGRAVRRQGPLDHRRQALSTGRSSTLAVPGGCWCRACQRHESEPAIFFVATDEPAQKRFTFTRGGADAAGDTVKSGDESPSGYVGRRLAARESSFEFAEPINTKLRVAYRLPRRRPGLGRRHDALHRAHAPAARNDLVDVADPRHPALARAIEMPPRLALAQGARRERPHDRQS